MLSNREEYEQFSLLRILNSVFLFTLTFYLHKQPSKLARNHGKYFATRVYTPGYPARPHPTPQDTIPLKKLNECYNYRNVCTQLSIKIHYQQFRISHYC